MANTSETTHSTFSAPDSILPAYLLAALVWSLLLGILLIYNLKQDEDVTLNTAIVAARANINKDIAFRKWGALHGGVYVPPTDRSPPNPYLHVPGRDVVTTAGKELTLMNPAYMMRQMMDEFSKEYGILSRITSLKPVNPDNSPDEWETRALHELERGVSEVLQRQDIDGKPYLRLMLPFRVDDSCLKCHAGQGYAIGDIRGGVVTSVPMAPYLASQARSANDQYLSYGGIWLIGLFGIAAFFARNRKLSLARFAAERKLIESEQQYRTLANSGMTLIWTSGPDKLCIYFNKVWLDFTGRTLDQELGNGWTEGVHPEDFPTCLETYVQAFDRREPFEMEYRLRHHDGHYRWIVDQGTPRFDADGLFIGYIGHCMDINVRKEAELEIAVYRDHLAEQVKARTAELASAKQAAETANIAKSAFLANMSHEIRTPLHAITGMVSILRRRGVDPDQREKLDKIESAGIHLLEIVNDVLDLSKIEAGKFSIEEDVLCVDEVIENVSGMIREKLQGKGLAYSVESACMPNNLLGDRVRLQQALLNYLSNAIKFTEAGRITLNVSIIEDLPDTMLLRFEVRDTGIGIAAEAMSRLFNVFEQADNSMSRKFGGTGLGLAISRKIAQQMGGDAGASSVLGQGSTFWFTARLKKGAMECSRRPAQPEAEEVLKRDCAGCRILVVDDEPINRQVARMMLEDVGLVVDEAENGTQAVQRVLDNPYDLILMDVLMPEMNGLEATRRIRHLPGLPHIPIIAISASAYDDDRLKCLAVGMDDFVSKPAKPETLYASLLRWLRKD